MSPWAKIDDRTYLHPKFVALDDAGWSLWIRALLYACHYRTDGYLEAMVVRRMGAARKTIRELVHRRIWEAAEGGYRIHDFLDYQIDSQGQRPAPPSPPPELSAIRAAAGRRGAEARWKDKARDALPSDGSHGKSLAKPDSKIAPGCHQNGTPDLPISRSPEKKDPRPHHRGLVSAAPFFGELLRDLRRGEGNT